MQRTSRSHRLGESEEEGDFDTFDDKGSNKRWIGGMEAVGFGMGMGLSPLQGHRRLDERLDAFLEHKKKHIAERKDVAERRTGKRF